MREIYRRQAFIGFGTAIGLIVANPGAAWATDAANANDDTTLSEIVVTAEKRAQDIQSVPASITALDATALDLGGVLDPTRLGALVPGMQVGFSGNEARIAMRGARQNDWGPEGATVVGVFNDGAFVPTTTQIMASYLDTQRIEVLRGPQGTLYGRNTYAGAINIVSNLPNFDHVEGDVEGTTGDYNERRLTGVLNLPINDTLAMRFALLTESHDGYVRNLYYGGHANDLENQNVNAERISLRWKPDDKFDATLRITYTDQDTNGGAIWGYEQIDCYRNNLSTTTPTGLSPSSTFHVGNCDQPGPQTPILTGTTGRPATAQDPGPWDVYRDSPSRDQNTSQTYNLQAAYDFGWSTLRMIAQYDKFSSLQYYDTDYSDGYFAGTNTLNNFFAGYDDRQRDKSVELHLVSSDQGPLQWIGGLYYFQDYSDWAYGYLLNDYYARYDNTIDPFESRSYAAFGNLTYAILDDFRLIGGLRYNQDNTKNQGSDDRSRSDKTLWKAGFEFDAAPHVMVYGHASTGYREGGVNATTLVEAGAPATYGPETILAYEVGLKTETADKRLSVDLSAYDNRFSNMQAQSFVTTCTVPNVLSSCVANQYIANGGEVTSDGVEFEVRWLPTDALFIDGNMSYMRARFGTYNIGQLEGLGNYEGRQDVTQSPGALQAEGKNPGLSLRGWTPAMSPPFTATAQISYQFNLNAENTVTPFVQEAFVSSYWSYDVNVPGVEQSSYHKTDLRVTWRNSRSKLEVEGFAQNLENRAVLVRSVVFDDSNADPNRPTSSIQAQYGDPRIWGVRMRVHF